MAVRLSAINGCSGFCTRCQTVHSIGTANSRKYCEQLLDQLECSNTLALETNSTLLKEKFSTESLYGAARGKMFGVMECMTKDGSVEIIKAFSGQYNNCWLLDGWCPPLFDVSAFESLTFETEKQIKNLGSLMKNCEISSPKWLNYKKMRKMLSQTLMQDIHKLYLIHDFRGNKLPLIHIFPQGHGIPTGTGDCCGPKLLNFAAMNNLRPLGMSEFYWGRENRSGSRQHGIFYPPCEDKCGPILGAMLCGLD